jgi:predicted phage terminase large subunit-like protein
MALDLASGSATGDYTAIVVCAIDRMRTLHVVELFRERCPPNEALDELYRLASRYGLHSCIADNDYATTFFAAGMRARSQDKRYPLHLDLLPLGGKDKEFRAQALRTIIHDEQLAVPANARWAPGLMDRLENFPVVSGPGVDDDIDCLSLIARRLSRLGLPAPFKSKTVGGAVVFGNDGSMTTRATLAEMFADLPIHTPNDRI